MFLIELIKNASWFLIFVFIFLFLISFIGGIVEISFFKIMFFLVLIGIEVIFFVALFDKRSDFLDRVLMVLGIISTLFLIVNL